MLCPGDIVAKGKNMHKSDVEFYRGKCRELEKRVRQLEKQLTTYHKMQHIIDDAHESLMEVEKVMTELIPKEKSERVDPCDKCEHGEMVIKFDYPELNKKIYACTSCGATRSKGV